MVFVYILFAAIIFYFVIRYAIRDAIIESQVNEVQLSFRQKNDNLILEVIDLESKISRQGNPEEKEKAKSIYNNSFEVYSSGKELEEVYKDLQADKDELVLLKKGL